MDPGQKVDSPATDDPTPLPLRVDALSDTVAPAPSPHAPATILAAIAATGEGGVWFPSKHASDAGMSRDLLDEPLAELRVAGLVRVAEWVRGVGQGYALTPEGQTAAADPSAVEKLLRQPTHIPTAAPDSPPNSPSEVDKPAGEFDFNPPVVVPALLMANALWFFVCVTYSIRWGLTPARALSEGHRDVLYRFGAVSGEWLLAGEWWRLLTSCFVHIGALHLLGNLFALAMMGPLAEQLWGRARLMLIYVVSGLAGSALAMAIRPDTILAGASGAIWGIQMSLFAWLFAFRHRLPPVVANDWFRRLMVVFVLNAGVSFLPSVSWEGHLGGGAVGFAAAVLLNAARSGGRTRRIGAVLLLALLPIMCIGMLAAAIDAKGLPRWQQLKQRVAAVNNARAQADRRAAVRDAEAEYFTHAVPRLTELSPERVNRAERDAGELVTRPKRPAERVEVLRRQVSELRAAAEAARKHTPAVPLGDDDLDPLLARARAATAARLHSFDLLLGFLSAPDPPTQEAWAAWQTARRDADRLWSEWRGR